MDLHVVYSSDNNYVQHVGVSLVSLLENNTEFTNIHIYLITNDISTENKDNLVFICEKYGRDITFINFAEFARTIPLNIGNSISINSYARLFLVSLLQKDIDKVLYLDCDSVIHNSLRPLWCEDISEHYAAGVWDTVADHTKEKINMPVDSTYINAGMLLINLKKWREDQVEQKFLDFINLHNGQVFHHDQGTINGVLHEKILILHPKYNAMTTFFTMSRDTMMKYYGMKHYYCEKELNGAVANPVFIHYTPAFVNRPWVRGSKHPLTYVYKEYLDMTPWKDTDLWEDKRRTKEKIVSFLYNYLPFEVANTICNLASK